MVGVFLDNSSEVRRLMESIGLEDKHITQVLNAYENECHVQEELCTIVNTMKQKLFP